MCAGWSTSHKCCCDASDVSRDVCCDEHLMLQLRVCGVMSCDVVMSHTTCDVTWYPYDVTCYVICDIIFYAMCLMSHLMSCVMLHVMSLMTSHMMLPVLQCLCVVSHQEHLSVSVLSVTVSRYLYVSNTCRHWTFHRNMHLLVAAEQECLITMYFIHSSLSAYDMWSSAIFPQTDVTFKCSQAQGRVSRFSWRIYAQVWSLVCLDVVDIMWTWVFLYSFLFVDW